MRRSSLQPDQTAASLAAGLISLYFIQSPFYGRYIIPILLNFPASSLSISAITRNLSSRRKFNIPEPYHPFLPAKVKQKRDHDGPLTKAKKGGSELCRPRATPGQILNKFFLAGYAGLAPLRLPPRCPNPLSLAILLRCSEYSLQTRGNFLGSKP